MFTISLKGDFNSFLNYFKFFLKYLKCICFKSQTLHFFSTSLLFLKQENVVIQNYIFPNLKAHSYSLFNAVFFILLLWISLFYSLLRNGLPLCLHIPMAIHFTRNTSCFLLYGGSHGNSSSHWSFPVRCSSTQNSQTTLCALADLCSVW